MIKPKVIVLYWQPFLVYFLVHVPNGFQMESTRKSTAMRYQRMFSACTAVSLRWILLQDFFSSQVHWCAPIRSKESCKVFLLDFNSCFLSCQPPSVERFARLAICISDSKLAISLDSSAILPSRHAFASDIL